MSETEKRVTTRRALFDLVWSKPMTHVAADFGSSGAHVRALCDRLKLPVPVQGHWMKLEVGKAGPKPDFPEVPELDQLQHEVTRPRARPTSPPIVRPKPEHPQAAAEPTPPSGDPASADDEPRQDHKLLRKTRAALSKAANDERLWVRGSGRFRLGIFGVSAERVCAILNSLISAVEARGWSFKDGDKGLEFAIDGEMIGFEIEERADTVPHVVTPAEERAKADYELRRARALRGIGQWPGPPPSIPTVEFKPTGQFLFKLDGGIRVEGLRRKFSDGKRQRLEDMIGDIVASLDCWSEGMKRWREQQERWRREVEESEERRRSAERRARMSGSTALAAISRFSIRRVSMRSAAAICRRT